MAQRFCHSFDGNAGCKSSGKTIIFSQWCIPALLEICNRSLIAFQSCPYKVGMWTHPFWMVYKLALISGELSPIWSVITLAGSAPRHWNSQSRRHGGGRMRVLIATELSWYGGLACGMLKIHVIVSLLECLLTNKILIVLIWLCTIKSFPRKPLTEASWILTNFRSSES